jgi:hypothetical protein
MEKERKKNETIVPLTATSVWKKLILRTLVGIQSNGIRVLQKPEPASACIVLKKDKMLLPKIMLFSVPTI